MSKDGKVSEKKLSDGKVRNFAQDFIQKEKNLFI
jgi:hypothetical protein